MQMQRIVICILMSCAILLLGSGTLLSWHNHVHAIEDMHEENNVPHHHDETNCELHAQLHMPMVSAGWVPLLVCLGLFIAFLTQLPRVAPALVCITPRPCRGPPCA